MPRISLLILSSVMCTSAATVTLRVGAFGTARTRVLELSPSDVVTVTPLPGKARTPSIDTYAYTADNELVAKDDDEVVAPEFTWYPPQQGRYYLLVRNATEIAGRVRIVIAGYRGEPAPLPTHVIQRVFFATDRVHGQGLPVAKLFGPEPAKPRALTYGMAYVSIPRNHKMGVLEGPSIFRLELRQEPEKHVVLERINAVGRDEFLKRVGARVKTSETREALVFVHGFNTTFEDASRRTAQISYDLAFAGAPILFSWPSQGGVLLTDYNADGRNSALSAESLRVFLQELAADAGVTNVHIVAHSMGNRVVIGALEKLAAHAAQPALRVKQVALMAPDIDADLFRGVVDALKSASQRVTLYASSADKALTISRQLVKGYPRAGEAGPDIVVMNGMDTIDVTSVGTDILGHGYFANNTSVLADLYYVLRNAPPKDRFGLRREKHESGQYYWVYRSANQ